MAGLPSALTSLIGVLERLPGIGPKSAIRLAFYLLNTPEEFIENLALSLKKIKTDVKKCPICFSVSEKEICEICSDTKRKKSIICVVERAIDVLSLEKVGGFEGVYHVLGGVINPLDHIGPDDIRIYELITKVEARSVETNGGEVEVILAVNPTMEGEATSLYIKKKLAGIDGVKVTRIGSGLPMGADMEFADQATLSRAMEGRRTL